MVLRAQGLLLGIKMAKNENGIWDLDDLVKNPTKQVFDKKIKEIEKSTHKFSKNNIWFSILEPNCEIFVSSAVASSDCVFSAYFNDA